MTEIPPQPEEMDERRQGLEKQLAERRRELEKKLAEELERKVAEERLALEEALERELAEERKVKSKEPLAPCPECGGQRAMFHLQIDWGGGILGIPISARSPTVMWLYACACLKCGSTTLRIHPKDMEQLRKEAENESGRPSGF